MTRVTIDLEANLDPHRAKAAEMFGVKYEDVTPTQRLAGKQSNYIRDYTGADVMLFSSARAIEERNATTIRILKQRPQVPYEFTIHPHFRFEDTPVDRARRELGFPIQEK